MSDFEDGFGKALPAADQWLSVSDTVASLQNEGDPIATGFVPLDRQCRRGGITPGRIVVIGGQPFSGKTTLVASIALHMAQKIPVFALFSDEGRSQAAIRMGVMLGSPLKEIEDRPLEASKSLAELLGERTLSLGKPDTEEANAQAVVAYAREKATEGCALVVLDSVQTIPAAQTNGDGQDSPRLAVKRFMTLCRSWASETKFIFLLTSQSNRASYRHRKGEENSLAMASFAESAAIEFMADVALVLGTPNESEVVPVEFVKNRLKGTKKNFHVRYDESTGRLLEVDSPTADDAREKIRDENHHKTVSKLADVILAKFSKHPTLSGRNIIDLIHARPVNVAEALTGLEAQGAIVGTPGPRGAILWSLARP